ncbi:carbohydrate kinase family protein [Actinomadura barringtoniae]|uniref:Carbohydrate kinase family protein n=1 Tax=Actinomadura barringtoniae TaxID=1427535 RepID=A0A939PJW8_9ACTN|nr:PfkB family carbohydrate kinase [Actinomadura barringtoniae]MBO2453662.1 carbohydrate kinase family protein [Actinomadura barringtoniae]
MAVVTLGVHIVDVLARPVEAIPQGQDTVLVDQIRMTAAGSAAGTAVDLAKLGNEVISVGAIGDDELGDLLVAVMTRHGVDVSGLVRRTGDQTSATILPIRPDGGRPSFHVPGANLTVTASIVDPGLLTAAGAVHLGGPDVTFGLNDPAFFDALEAARASGTVVTMDLLSNMPDLVKGAAAFLPHVDYFLPNEEQALMMTGTGDPVLAARKLLAEGPRAVLITLGEHGSLVATTDGVERIPAIEVDVVDTTGCGDAYCAGFITGLMNDRDLGEAARWGTAAAATVAQGLGSDACLTGLDAVLALLD